MKIVAVFHGKKVEGLAEMPSQIAANPPMTPQGMVGILDLVETVKGLGPYTGAYVSRVARALDTASVLAIELDMDFVTVKGLGQHANLDIQEGQKVVIMYPGYENDLYEEWQTKAVKAIGQIADKHDTGDDITILIVSHRPVIGGLVAFARGITETDGIKEIVSDPATSANGYVIFNLDGERKLTIVEDAKA